jgi:hypothetical protein
MPIPKYFVLERAKALQEQEKRLGEILAKLGPQEREGVSVCIIIISRSIDVVPHNGTDLYTDHTCGFVIVVMFVQIY